MDLHAVSAMVSTHDRQNMIAPGKLPGAPSVTTDPVVRSRLHRWLRWLLPGVLVVGFVLVHRPFLRLLGGLLVAEQPRGSSASTFVLLPADRMTDYLAERLQSSPATQVLLIDEEPTRLDALGVRLSWVEERRQALLLRDIPAMSIQVLHGGARNDWERARVLRDWFRDHQDTEIAVVCDRFRSSRLRIILDRVLGPDTARVHIIALADRRYDETNWWRSKEGVMGCWDGFTRLAYVGCAGEGDPPIPLSDVDTYERSLP
jgi:hypothetical protein